MNIGLKKQSRLSDKEKLAGRKVRAWETYIRESLD